jgi:DNA polymerase-3 subunit epsilon
LEELERTMRELLVVAAKMGEPPAVVGKAEVDQINIISRWIHRHSDDRAFFSFQSALADQDRAERLLRDMWVAIDAVRMLPLLDEDDED